MALAFCVRFGRATHHNQSFELTRASFSSAIAANFAQGMAEAEEKTNPHAIRTELSSLCINGHLKEALCLLNIMDQQSIPVDSQVYISLLEACANRKALREGNRVHNHMLATGFDHNILLCTKLVNMYVICGSLENARLVFEKVETPNVYIWNAIIIGYSRFGFHEEVLRLHCRMQKAITQPDKYTFPSVLRACAGLLERQHGQCAHSLIIKNGLESDVVVASALAGMYAKLGKMDNARHLFDKMPHRDVTAWNSMISSYAQKGYFGEALKLFNEMEALGLQPNLVTFTSVLPACARLSALEQGKAIHDHLIRGGFELDVILESALVDMYAKCGSIEVARELFDNMSQRNTVSFNAMISGYVQNGRGLEALKLFRDMQLAGPKADSTTLTIILPACAHIASLDHGKLIHGYIIRSNSQDVFVGSALVDMYTRCGSIGLARQVFDKMLEKNAVSWNVMIAGYAMHGHGEDALTLFHEMQMTGIRPDSVTYANVLPACAHMAALQQGKEIHDCIIDHGFESDVFVAGALIDMYVKCGSLQAARQVFDKMPEKDLVSWTSMIAGYGMHGLGDDALTLFHQMQESGVKPDHVTFVAVLSACSHGGLVDEGVQYFDQMIRTYSIKPRMEHYACVVDLLGRAGRLEEAHGMIKMMPFEPDTGVWGALLGACRIHKNVELGEHVANILLQMEPDNVGFYVLLSNIYADSGRWDDVAKLRKMMKDRDVRKEPGFSWIEINNGVHTFLVED